MIETYTDIEELNQTNNFKIHFIRTNHQGDCIGYKIVGQDWSMCYIPDNQLHDTEYTSFNDFVSFCQNVTLLIHDSQYTPEDMPYKQNWGHSLYTDALRLGIEAKVKNLALFHHDPNRSKKDILTMVDHCMRKTSDLTIFAAEERQSFNLLGN